MKGLGALQRHQLPHPLAKILDPPLLVTLRNIHRFKKNHSQYARCVGIFNVHLTANLPGNLLVKKFHKSAKN